MAHDGRDASREESFPRSWRFLARAPRNGASCSVMSHWGEVIQGPVLFEGRPHVALVTLPDPAHFVTVAAMPAHYGIRCNPSSKSKAMRAARLVMKKWAPGLGVELAFHSTIPEGVGAGSSTADCTATIYAIREMLGPPASHASELDILADVFAAEGPCDPLILLDGETTLLWGSRSGKLLETYNVPLPAFFALGFVTEPGRTVSTVELAREQAQHPPSSREIDAFAAVLRDFEHALLARSIDGVAKAAMASGSLNQSRCPIDAWDTLMKLSHAVGALGISCAHSGTAAAFLFDPATADLDARLERATRELQRLRAAHIHHFRTDASPRFRRESNEMTIER